MKTKSPPLAERKKARVMYLYLADFMVECLNDKPLFDGGAETPVLVISFPTASAAKRRLKWERMSEEQKVEFLAQGLRTIEAPHFVAKVSWKRCIDKSHYRELARAVLHLLEGERK